LYYQEFFVDVAKLWLAPEVSGAQAQWQKAVRRAIAARTRRTPRPVIRSIYA
jgi:hypothetical protein